jgi:hypothetical protein
MRSGLTLFQYPFYGISRRVLDYSFNIFSGKNRPSTVRDKGTESFASVAPGGRESMAAGKDTDAHPLLIATCDGWNCIPEKGSESSTHSTRQLFLAPSHTYRSKQLGSLFPDEIAPYSPTSCKVTPTTRTSEQPKPRGHYYSYSR